ncbi:MAG: hypothetical protein EXR76_15710 [Myxococcales bacterium]|nr:hypothetical protein [Myxococcales bacterium]
MLLRAIAAPLVVLMVLGHVVSAQAGAVSSRDITVDSDFDSQGSLLRRGTTLTAGLSRWSSTLTMSARAGSPALAEIVLTGTDHRAPGGERLPAGWRRRVS